MRTCFALCLCVLAGCSRSPDETEPAPAPLATYSTPTRAEPILVTKAEPKKAETTKKPTPKPKSPKKTTPKPEPKKVETPEPKVVAKPEPATPTITRRNIEIGMAGTIANLTVDEVIGTELIRAYSGGLTFLIRMPSRGLGKGRVLKDDQIWKVLAIHSGNRNLGVDGAYTITPIEVWEAEEAKKKEALWREPQRATAPPPKPEPKPTPKRTPPLVITPNGIEKN